MFTSNISSSGLLGLTLGLLLCAVDLLRATAVELPIKRLKAVVMKAPIENTPHCFIICLGLPLDSPMSNVNTCMPLQKMEINVLISMMAVFLADLCGSSETDEEDSVRPYMEDGGWATFPGDLLVRPGPCNIPIRDSRMTQAEFTSEFATSQPLVVRDVSNNDLFRALSRRRRLLADYGHTSITLSAANTHSYEKKIVTFKDYCEKYTGPQRLSTPANETFYMFGDHNYLEWGDLFAEYSPPPYSLPRHKPAYSFGVAGPGTGVPFHFHGPGWAEAIHGRKRWFLTPPDQQPNFHPNKTTLQWFLEDYPTEKVNQDILYDIL